MSGDGGGRRYFAANEADAATGTGAQELTVEDGRPGRVRLDERTAEVRVLPPGSRFVIRLGGRSAAGVVEWRDGAWQIELEGRSFVVRVDDERIHRLRELTTVAGQGTAPRELRAPMPGRVTRVLAAPGDRVAARAPLVVMEAMKMENELRAERDGVVAEVHVAEGATVDRDDLLVTFEADMEST